LSRRAARVTNAHVRGTKSRCAVSHQLNHPCVWGPLVTILVLSIKIEYVNRRVRRAARVTNAHVRRACLC
jgi:hypothetical protein